MVPLRVLKFECVAVQLRSVVHELVARHEAEHPSTVRPPRERRLELPAFVDEYNRHQPHTACGNQPPISRLTSLPGQHYWQASTTAAENRRRRLRNARDGGKARRS